MMGLSTANAARMKKKCVCKSWVLVCGGRREEVEVGRREKSSGSPSAAASLPSRFAKMKRKERDGDNVPEAVLSGNANGVASIDGGLAGRGRLGVRMLGSRLTWESCSNGRR